MAHMSRRRVPPSRQAILLGRLLRPLVVFLFLLSYLLFLHGTLFPIVNIESGMVLFPGAGVADQTMAMPSTLQSLWEDRCFVPLFLVTTFSLFVPCLKLVLFFISVGLAPPAVGEFQPEREQREAEEGGDREKGKSEGYQQDNGEKSRLRLMGNVGQWEGLFVGEGSGRWRGERDERGGDRDARTRCEARLCSSRESDCVTRVSAVTLSDLNSPASTSVSSSRPESSSSTSSGNDYERQAWTRKSRGRSLGPRRADLRTKAWLFIMGFLLFISKYQLVDVYVFVLMVLFVHFPLVRVTPLPAAFSFLFYCILSIFATKCLSWVFTAFPRSTRHTTQPRGGGARSRLSLRNLQTGLETERDSRGDRAPGTSPAARRRRVREDTDEEKGCKNGGLPHASEENRVNRGTAEDEYGTYGGEASSFALCPEPSSAAEEQPPLLLLLSPSRMNPFVDPTGRASGVRGSWRGDERRGGSRDSSPFASDQPRGCGGSFICCGSRHFHSVSSLCFPSTTTSATHAACICRDPAPASRPALASCHAVSPQASSHVSSSQPEEDDVGVGECFFRTISILLFTLIAAVSARAAWCLPLLYVVVALDEEKAIGIDGTFLSLSQLAEESLCLGESIVGFVVLILFPLLVPFAHLLASCLAMFITLLLRLLHPGPRSRRLPRTGGSRIKRWCRTLGLPILLKHLLSYMLSLSQFLTCWAMADVFALGLFTAYFTINAVHILVARIPAVSPSTPAFASSFSCLSSSLLSPCRLFSRFLPLESALPFGSGFWASMVFGASASQLHHLLPSQVRIDRVVRMALGEERKEDETRFDHEGTDEARGWEEWQCRGEGSTGEMKRRRTPVSPLGPPTSASSYSPPSFLSTGAVAASFPEAAQEPLGSSPSSSFCASSASCCIPLPASPSRGHEGARDGGFPRFFFPGRGSCKRRRTGRNAGATRPQEESLFSWRKSAEETPHMSRLSVPLLAPDPAPLQHLLDVSRPSEAFVRSRGFQDEAKEGGEFLPSLAGERQALEAFAGEISDTENAVGPSPVCLFEANTKGRGAGSTSGVRRGPPEEGPAVGNLCVWNRERHPEREEKTSGEVWSSGRTGKGFHPGMCRQNTSRYRGSSGRCRFLPSSLLSAPLPSSSPFPRLAADLLSEVPGQSNREAERCTEERKTQTDGNPRHLLHLSLQVFGRLGVVLTLIVALYAWPAEKPRHLDLDKINETVVLYYPAISQGARPLIPASIGNCTADSPEPPPEPCVGHNFLYHSRNAYYETTARWVSGVNTTDIEEIRLSGRDPQRETARREGEDPFCITDFHVSPLTINESVLGLFSVTVATITEAVERELTRLIQAYLEPDNNFIPWDKDTRISLQALVNHLAVVNAPGGLLCRPSPGTSTSLFDTQAKPRETSEAETHEEF
uniref:Transmembrane protein n=1 Tax=Neospora caninum (strain Liverpool) TaxID=572307 RepID=A0A0F7UJ36_NEOCL|nr:TPA: hypothetical protein BN1204_047770 [Neospora caninum Liverpool]